MYILNLFDKSTEKVRHLLGWILRMNTDIFIPKSSPPIVWTF